MRALEDAAEAHGIHNIFLVAGNHDYGARELAELRAAWPGRPAPFTDRGVLQLLPRAAHWDWAGRRWLAVAGATSLDFYTRHGGGLHYDPAAEAVLDSDVAVAANADRVDVLIAHDAPLSPQTIAVARVREENPFSWAPDILAEARLSTERLQHIVDTAEPELILHGHLHRSDRITEAGTTVISLAQERHPGNLVAVDLATLDVVPIPL